MENIIFVYFLSSPLLGELTLFPSSIQKPRPKKKSSKDGPGRREVLNEGSKRRNSSPRSETLIKQLKRLGIWRLYHILCSPQTCLLPQNPLLWHKTPWCTWQTCWTMVETEQPHSTEREDQSAKQQHSGSQKVRITNILGAYVCSQ